MRHPSLISRNKEESKLRRDKSSKNKLVLKGVNVGDRRPDIFVDLPRSNKIESDLVFDLTGQKVPTFENDMLGIENTLSANEC